MLCGWSSPSGETVTSPVMSISFSGIVISLRLFATSLMLSVLTYQLGNLVVRVLLYIVQVVEKKKSWLVGLIIKKK